MTLMLDTNHLVFRLFLAKDILQEIKHMMKTSLFQHYAMKPGFTLKTKQKQTYKFNVYSTNEFSTLIIKHL